MSEPSLQDDVAELLRDWRGRLSTQPAVVWGGYSGGVDSTALLLSLLSLRESDALDVRCIHVNHGIHPQAND